MFGQAGHLGVAHIVGQGHGGRVRLGLVALNQRPEFGGLLRLGRGQVLRLARVGAQVIEFGRHLGIAGVIGELEAPGAHAVERRWFTRVLAGFDEGRRLRHGLAVHQRQQAAAVHGGWRVAGQPGQVEDGGHDVNLAHLLAHAVAGSDDRPAGDDQRHAHQRIVDVVAVAGDGGQRAINQADVVEQPRAAHPAGAQRSQPLAAGAHPRAGRLTGVALGERLLQEFDAGFQVAFGNLLAVVASDEDDGVVLINDPQQLAQASVVAGDGPVVLGAAVLRRIELRQNLARAMDAP